MKTFRLVNLFCLCGISLLIWSSAAAQDQEQEEALHHEVTVTLKLIQVYVSTKDGQPVQDLTRDDFLLYDNGLLKNISDFEVHRLPALSESENRDISVQISRKFYLFLDAYRNDGMGLIKARKTALHFIDTSIQPDDELGLLSYSIGKGLIVHCPLTTEHEKIRDAVQTVKLFPWITPANNGETEITEGLDFVESLNEFAVSLRYVPGYKHIVLFSAGLPQSFFDPSDHRLLTEYEALVKELASASCSIYTIDTQGLRDLTEGREQKGDDSLRRISSQTGGQHFRNVDHQEDISGDIQNSTAFYYVLGYTVDEEWDGKFHEIKVKVNRKGLNVQAQKGYFNPKVFAKFTKLEKRLHLVDLARNSSPQFALPKKIDSFCGIWTGNMALNLSEIVPGDFEDIFTDKAEFFLLIYNLEGELVAEGTKDLDFREDPPERVSTYAFSRLPPGRYDCITILRNKRTGAAARALSSLELLETDSPVSGPVLFVPDKKTLLQSVPVTVKDKTSTPENLSLGTLAPDVEGPLSPLVFDLNKDTPVLYAVFANQSGAAAGQVPFMSAQLKSKTEEHSYTLQVSQRSKIPTPQDSRLVFEIALVPVPADEYVLEVSITGSDPADSRIYSQNVSIR